MGLGLVVTSTKQGSLPLCDALSVTKKIKAGANQRRSPDENRFDQA
jgi:hypothetical protein